MTGVLPVIFIFAKSNERSGSRGYLSRGDRRGNRVGLFAPSVSA